MTRADAPPAAPHGPSDSPAPALGFVMSGGAARGAYEAGVLRFVLGDLPRRLGHPTWPRVVSGTSVGALNGLFAAARDPVALGNLGRIWRSLRIEDIYRVRPLGTMRDIVRLGLARLKDAPAPARDGEPEAPREFALLDATPFHGLLADHLPGTALRKAIDSGATWALVVAATEVQTGFNALFVDGQLELPPQAGTRVYHAPITAVHCRASAAIPFVFPAVAIGGRWHVDGGLRQNTPLRPVLSAGVDRALIVGVKQDREDEARSRAEARERPLASPSPLFLAGKMLNALMLDPVERDLWSAQYRNSVVDWGTTEFGPDFATRAAGDLGLRRVDIVHLRPTEDLGKMAGDIYRARPPRASRAVRFLLDRVHAWTHDVEADLLSYLYFDREYTAALEQLGWEDAHRAEASLARLYA